MLLEIISYVFAIDVWFMIILMQMHDMFVFRWKGKQGLSGSVGIDGLPGMAGPPGPQGPAGDKYTCIHAHNHH